uniref:Uncharacterized protein n=1 Tax=Oryza barthii TaxID=65489 RepID=A0A0D3GXH4_9ORYZ
MDPTCQDEHKSGRSKQEAELDGAATALLAELPQFESPSTAPPLHPNPSQLATASEDDDGKGGNDGRKAKKARAAGDKVTTTDWRALGKFIASQLSPGECGSMAATQEAAVAAAVAGVSSQLDHGDDDKAALLFLNSDKRDKVDRWTGLLGSAGASGVDGDLGICVFEKRGTKHSQHDVFITSTG